jgi:hypothetical protein
MVQLQKNQIKYDIDPRLQSIFPKIARHFVQITADRLDEYKDLDISIPHPEEFGDRLTQAIGEGVRASLANADLSAIPERGIFEEIKTMETVKQLVGDADISFDGKGVTVEYGRFLRSVRVPFEEQDPDYPFINRVEIVPMRVGELIDGRTGDTIAMKEYAQQVTLRLKETR